MEKARLGSFYYLSGLFFRPVLNCSQEHMEMSQSRAFSCGISPLFALLFLCPQSLLKLPDDLRGGLFLHIKNIGILYPG